MKKESRQDRIERLTKEGRLEDFLKRGRELDDMIIAETVTAEAKEQLLDQEFGERPIARALRLKADQAAKPNPPTMRDCEWVYQNIGKPEVDSEHAPSPGAAGLLAQARGDKQIYKWLLDRLTPKSFAMQDDKANKKALKLTGLDDKLRKEFGELAAKVF